MKPPRSLSALQKSASRSRRNSLMVLVTLGSFFVVPSTVAVVAGEMSLDAFAVLLMFGIGLLGAGIRLYRNGDRGPNFSLAETAKYEFARLALDCREYMKSHSDRVERKAASRRCRRACAALLQAFAAYATENSLTRSVSGSSSAQPPDLFTGDLQKFANGTVELAALLSNLVTKGEKLPDTLLSLLNDVARSVEEDYSQLGKGHTIALTWTIDAAKQCGATPDISLGRGTAELFVKRATSRLAGMRPLGRLLAISSAFSLLYWAVVLSVPAVESVLSTEGKVYAFLMALTIVMTGWAAVRK